MVKAITQQRKKQGLGNASATHGQLKQIARVVTDAGEKYVEFTDTCIKTIQDELVGAKLSRDEAQRVISQGDILAWTLSSALVGWLKQANEHNDTLGVCGVMREVLINSIKVLSAAEERVDESESEGQPPTLSDD